MEVINKKFLFALVGFVLFLIILLLVFLYFQDRNVISSSEKFRDYVISNGLGDSGNFIPEKDEKDVKTNIGRATAIIKENLVLKAEIANADSSEIKQLVARSEEFADNGEFEQSLSELKAAASQANQAVDKYKKQAKPDVDKINSLVTKETLQVQEEFSLTNHAILDDWAVITLDPGNNQIDYANVIMKKVNGTWTIFEGPVSAFIEDELAQKGVPQGVITRANTIYYTNLLNPVN